MTILQWQWLLLVSLSAIMFWLAPKAKTIAQFFSAENKNGSKPGLFLLTSSLVISWIFAKSITNAANLGSAFGIVGGVAYAGYYGSFIVAGLVIYNMRTQGGFESIHQFLQQKFGRTALLLFSVSIAFRLFNEVWSNTMVIGSYFGEAESFEYYVSILVFTALTLAYVLKGGMSSSLLTDAIQMVLFAVLLAVILMVLLPSDSHQLADYFQSGTWTAAQGLNLLFVALIQMFSYPFHDPVMTDRGFISAPKITRKAFILAGIVGAACIVLFSFVGIYAQLNGLEGQAPVVVAQTLGTGLMLAMNLIMITSAASTLDSTFSSVAKLTVIDLKLAQKIGAIKAGRLAMIVAAIAGTIPVFLSAEILSATTISGTMVIGLAPPFLLWKMKVPKLSFVLSVIGGIAFGVLLALDLFPNNWNFTQGNYAALLSVNIIGTAVCFLLFLIPKWIKRNG